jgi:lipoate-protein ligase A
MVPRSNPCRLLPFACASGPDNMAADEALLESAALGSASLRFYGWDVPTLSLGYFQPDRLRHADGRLAALPCVRRASGGGALVHHHEVTYALALPAGPAWQPAKCSWIGRMHEIVAVALRSLGVPVVLGKEERKLADVLCFLHQTPCDLLLDGHKVVGSAQRRQRGALLQHGAILLSQSEHAPALPGIAELTGHFLTVAETCATVRRAFQEHTGWDLVSSVWTAAEQERTAELAPSKYGSDAWNRKR